MKAFWKDLWELNLHSCRFLKKHWFGYIILLISSFLSGYIGELLMFRSYDYAKSEEETEEA